MLTLTELLSNIIRRNSKSAKAKTRQLAVREEGFVSFDLLSKDICEGFSKPSRFGIPPVDAEPSSCDESDVSFGLLPTLSAEDSGLSLTVAGVKSCLADLLLMVVFGYLSSSCESSKLCCFDGVQNLKRLEDCTRLGLSRGVALVFTGVKKAIVYKFTKC